MVALHQARWLLPVVDEPLEIGSLAIDGDRIVAVGHTADLQRRFPDATRTDHGAAVLLPGLINAHTHLELSWMGEAELPRGDYRSWLAGLMSIRNRVEEVSAREAATRALNFAVERGTAAFGDICNGTWIIELLAADHRIDAVLFHEFMGIDPVAADSLLTEGLARVALIAGVTHLAPERLRVHPTPHSAHTASPALLIALADHARSHEGLLSIHLAESPEEVEFLTRGTGGLRSLFDELGFTAAGYVAPGLGPVDHADECQLLFPGTLLVHGVQLSAESYALLRGRGVTVVTCPRSNRRLGVGQAPVVELLQAGVPVALGTDSLASVEDLDPFAELVALCEVEPTLSPATALQIATLNGARALRIDDRLGSLEPGKRARVLAIDLPGDAGDPYAALRSNPTERRWIGSDGSNR